MCKHQSKNVVISFPYDADTSTAELEKMVTQLDKQYKFARDTLLERAYEISPDRDEEDRIRMKKLFSAP